MAEDAEKTYHEVGQSLVLAKVKGQNEFAVYSKKVGKWTSFTFPQGVKATPVMFGDGCVFDLVGEEITEVVAVDAKGNWCSSKLSSSTKRCAPVVAFGVAVVSVEGKAYAFSGELGQWDSVPAMTTPQVLNGLVLIVEPEPIAAFSSATGKWAVTKRAR